MDTLLLDAGNILYKKKKNKILNEKKRITADGIANIYTILGYDAMAVGPTDLRGGIPQLLAQAASGVPWISANLVNSDGEHVFPAYKLVETSLGQIGIIGLTADTKIGGDELKFLPWDEALTAQIAELKSRCTLLILLTSMIDTGVESIIADFPEIDIVITANPKSGNIKPRIINNSLHTQTHSQGKYLGQLRLSWPKGSGTINSNLNMNEAKIRSRFRALTESIDEDPEIVNLLHQLKEKTAN